MRGFRYSDLAETEKFGMKWSLTGGHLRSRVCRTGRFNCSVLFQLYEVLNCNCRLTGNI